MGFRVLRHLVKPCNGCNEWNKEVGRNELSKLLSCVCPVHPTVVVDPLRSTMHARGKLPYLN